MRIESPLCLGAAVLALSIAFGDAIWMARALDVPAPSHANALPVHLVVDTTVADQGAAARRSMVIRARTIRE
jgi:hypothetical protein